MESSDIKLLNKRRISLQNDQSSWVAHWDELSRFILPRNSKLLNKNAGTKSEGGRKLHNEIYDGSATKAARVCAAGLMSGLTSRSRPWFVLQTPDMQLNKYKAVRIWLNDVTKIIESVLAKSNVYRGLYSAYEDLGVFGTHASFLYDDFKNIIHMQTLSIGEYSLSANFKGEVDTIYIDRWYSVGALIKQFGLENCSHDVVKAFRAGNLERMIQVTHTVEPREDRELNNPSAKNMAFKSIWFESSKTDKVLRESGFKQFPAVTPRWNVNSSDVYGMSPGMDALGDVKQLQQSQLRKSQAIDFASNPPLQLPISMKNQETKMQPGARFYYDAVAGSNGIKTAFDVRLDINALVGDIAETQDRIKKTFFNDIFMMVVQKTTQMTAYEVAERHEEKLLMLGPVVERVSNELLDPIVETTFNRLAEAGLLPDAPPEMQGQTLVVDYISIIAQAQKAIGVNNIDRFTMGMMNVAQAKPEVLDKFSADDWVDIYSDDLAIDPELILSDNEVAEIRNARAKQQEVAAQQQAILGASQAAANAGKIPADSPLVEAMRGAQ